MQKLMDFAKEKKFPEKSKAEERLSPKKPSDEPDRYSGRQDFGRQDSVQKRRLPCIEKTVSEISEQDIRVSVIGAVIDNKDRRVVIDDGTGRLEASFDLPIDAKNADIVRIFSRVMPVENGLELHGEILQNVSKMDMDVLRKVKELEAKILN